MNAELAVYSKYYQRLRYINYTRNQIKVLEFELRKPPLYYGT